MRYKVISTGSQGNAVIINDIILIDCGVSFKTLKDYYKKLSIVLLTHIHSDHFNKATIKKLAFERPLLRFGCCEWLVSALVDCGVSKTNIDVLEVEKYYCYKYFGLYPVKLTHNVPNCGYKLEMNGQNLFYATDTGDLYGIEAKNYDLYMIECNHTEEELWERIKNKLDAGEYCYEFEAAKNHLSKAKCDDFIYSNIGPNSEYVYLHGHVEREG
jgi:L-ascorbate metabolism protein UlaG (beta-lactamase superfamily)